MWEFLVKWMLALCMRERQYTYFIDPESRNNWKGKWPQQKEAKVNSWIAKYWEVRLLYLAHTNTEYSVKLKFYPKKLQIF